jgi:hypothetical protein
MAKYIAREVLEVALNYRLSFLKAEKGEHDHYTCGFDEAVTTVENFPEADVAPVVRCNDCKYRVDATINANGFLICDISNMEIAPDDFCSYGEYQTNMGGVTNE